MPHFDGQIHSTQGFFDVVSKSNINVFINYDGEGVECEICEDWRLENNGKTIAINMIQGIKFHNGKEMTSADVAYSLKKMMGQIDNIGSPRCGVLREYVTSIETPSKYVLRINISRGAAFVPKLLSIASCIIYPDGTTREDLQSEPLGSGPFLLESAVTGVGQTFVRNPDYFKPGLPYLDEVEMTIIQGSAATMAAFLTRKRDYTGSRTPAEQYLPQLYKLRDEGRVNFRKGLSGCSPQGAFAVVTNPPFDDIRVRKAMNLALDREAWSILVYGGDTTVSLLFPPTTPFGRPESDYLNKLAGWGTGAKKQQEIEDGKKLMADAGFPNGIDIPHMSSTGGSTLRMNEVISEQVAKVGIRTTLDLVGGATRSTRELAHDYVILSWRYCQTTRDPDELFGQSFITGGSRNVIDYSNAEIDSLYAQMSAEVDASKRKQLVRQMEDIVVFQDVAFGPMPQQFDQNFWWTHLKNFTFGLSSGFASGQYRADTIWIQE